MISTIALTMLLAAAPPKLTVDQVAAGSVVTALGYGVKVNDGSSLQRTCYVINDPSAPVGLSNVAIKTRYRAEKYGGDYEFTSDGTATFTKGAAAFSVVHVLFDVFGERMKGLVNTEVQDVAPNAPVQLTAVWRAWEHDVKHYLTCISYVRQVRTAEGGQWRANLDAVFAEFSRILPNLTKDAVDPERPKPPEAKGK